MAVNEIVIGIDPGLKGALVVVDTTSGQLLVAVPMPAAIMDLYKFFCSTKAVYPSAIIACEKAQTIPGRQSVKGAFTQGRNFGVLQGVITMLHMPVHYIPPLTWQAEMHKGADGPGPKERSLCVAKNLWPCEKFTFTEKQIKPQDGIVDALLIAEYLRRRVK